MIYHVDSSVCVEFLRGNVTLPYPMSSMAVSSVVVFELQKGVLNAPPGRRAHLQALLNEFLASVRVEPFDDDSSRTAAKVADQLKTKGTPIGPYDTLIAGHAIQAKATLLTNNTSEFKRVKGLKIEAVIKG